MTLGYADDLLVMVNNKDELSPVIRYLMSITPYFNFKLSLNKTRIVCFTSKKPKIGMKVEDILFVPSYKYLGLSLNYYFNNVDE